jgi:hypothetical protein
MKGLMNRSRVRMLAENIGSVEAAAYPATQSSVKLPPRRALIIGAPVTSFQPYLSQ